MDFIDQIQAISVRIAKLQDNIKTEEAAKNAFVLPFINALGYDVFDPLEVIPEFTADVGTKKGEKVDYAIMRDGQPIILIECKQCGTKLSFECASQLYRYFSVTTARIGILTDGILYKFFTDLQNPNKMDEKPFMEFNMLDIQEPLVTEIKKMSKTDFDLNKIINTAGDLKYTREIKKILAEQLVAPAPDFVRFFVSQIYTGIKTQSVLEQFSDITRRAFHQFVNEHINDRLKSAMVAGASPTPKDQSTEPSAKIEDDGIVTTSQETEAYQIIKAILREDIEPEKVVMKDGQTYCAILFENNNRKPIARLYFNQAQKKIGVFNDKREEEKIPINSMNDIYKLSARLKEPLKLYMAFDPAPAPTADSTAEPSTII